MPHHRILGQAGTSLADMYDVEGSIAGIAELDSESVKTVHELGATIFSERLRSAIVLLDSAALSQSTDFEITFDNPVLSRLTQVNCLTNNNASIDNVQISLSRLVPAEQDSVIWVGDIPNEVLCRFMVEGVVRAGTVIPPLFSALPQMIIGQDQPEPRAEQVSMRGRTAAFGAGTVVVTLGACILRPDIQGVSSFGLPIPSW